MKRPSSLPILMMLLLVAPAAHADFNVDVWKNAGIAGTNAMTHGNYAEAEKQYNIEIAEGEKADTQNRTYRVARGMYQMATCLMVEMKLAESEAMFKRALQMMEQDPTNMSVTEDDMACLLINFSTLYITLNRFDVPEPMLLRALQLREKTFGYDSKQVAESLNFLSQLYVWQNNFGKAAPVLERAVKIAEKTLGPTNPTTINYLDALASVYERDKQLAKAKAVRERAATIK